MKVFRVAQAVECFRRVVHVVVRCFAHSVVVRFIDLFPKLLMEEFKLCACRDGGLGFRL